MTTKARDSLQSSLYRLAQIGTAAGVQLVRLLSVDQGNVYTAKAIEFDENGATVVAEDTTIAVTNLAEPAGSPGLIEASTDAVAIDVEGHWVVFVRQAGFAMFSARIVSASGNAIYAVREQELTSQGAFIDKAGASDISARNLAELSLGSGAAVGDGVIVLATTVLDNTSPPNLAYVFDHPVYAKYLD